MTDPVLIDDFAGAGGSFLPNYERGGSRLTPPVSWMGGKRRIAPDTFALLGLRIGGCVDAVVNDGSWWGWVWPVVLDSETGPAVSEVLRSWRGEDPRGLWFRLRDAGPMEGAVDGAAQLLWLQARAASGVPVWWQGTDKALKLVQWASTQIDGAGQRQASETRDANAKGYNGTGRLIATSRGNQPPGAAFDAGQKGTPSPPGLLAPSTDIRGGGGIVDPGTIADRLDTIRRAVARNPPILTHMDAAAFADEWAPRLGSRARVSRDPPYQNATGYPMSFTREAVLASSEVWARHGARIVVHEAVGLAQDLGPGWTQVQLRRGKKSEWATCYGCDVRDVLPAFLRLTA